MIKILAIDDQEDNLSSIKAILHNAMDNVKLFTALSGQQGIEIARKEQPDTILLDVKMPELDGFEVCKILKSEKSTSHIPIIMLTAIMTDSKNRIKALKLGADTFIAKPFDPVEFITQIKVMLRIKKVEDELKLKNMQLEEKIKKSTSALSKSKKKYEMMANLLPQIVYEHDLKGILTFHNDYAIDFLGYTREELQDFNVKNAFVPEDREMLRINSQRLYNGKKPINHQFNIQKKDGSRIPVLIYSSLMRKNNKPLGIRGVVVDISKQKLIGKRLELSKEKALKSASLLKSILESPEGIIIFSLDENYCYTSFTNSHENTMKAIWGARIKKGMNILDTIKSPSDKKKAKKNFDKALSGKNFVLIEEYGNEQLKRSFWENRYSPIIETNGRIMGLTVFATDISEQRQAEQNLKLSEERFKSLYNNSTVGMYRTTPDGKIILANPALVKMMGFNSFEELANRNLNSQGFKENIKRKIFIGKIEKSGKVHGLKSEWEKKNGETIYVEESAKAIRDANDKTLYYDGTVEDVSDKIRVTMALQESEEKFRSIVENSHEGIGLINNEGKFTYINDNLVKIFGFPKEEVEGSDFRKFLADESLKLVSKRFKGLQKGKRFESSYEIVLQQKDGKKVYSQLNSSVINNKENNPISILHLVDITEQKKSILDLKKSKKETEASEKKFRELFEKSADSILIIKNRKFVDCNEAALKLLRYNTKEEFLNTHPSKLSPQFQPDGKASFSEAEELMDQAIKNGKHRFEWDHLKSNGETIAVEVSLTTISDQKDNEVIHTVWRDISARRKSENELKESVINFRLIFEHSPIGIYMATRGGKIIDANQALLNILGSPSIEATKAINVLQFPPLINNGYAEKFKHCVNDGIIEEFEMDYKSKWGRSMSLHSFLIPLKDDDGNISKVYTLIEDITNRKIAENKLRESETRFKMFMDNIPAGIFIKDSDGKFLFSNKYNKDVHGLDDWEGKTTYDFFPKEIADKFCDDSNKVLNGEDMIVIDYVADKNNNTIIYKNHEFSIKKTDGTKLLGGISIDITKEKLSEIELQKSEERFDLAMKASNDGLFDWNLITNEIYYSARYKEMLGYTDEEFPNELASWEKHCHEGERELSLQKLKHAIENKIAHYDVEFRMMHKDGKWRNILSRGRIIYDDKGRAIRGIGTHADLTEQKKAEQNLKNALAKAEESDMLKSAFLANMSHEIRTPMNGIIGFANLLKNPKLSEKDLSSYVNVIEKSGARMLNIINDLVDISKIEAGQVEVNLSECEIYEQMHFLYTFFKAETDNKGMQLSAYPSFTNEKLIVITDREKLYAILTNLIKNAIKYSHKGSIEFGCIVKGKNKDSFLEFYVKDTGIGIPADRLEAIFDRFVQADIEDRKVYEGAGLGLSITRAYIELLGGKIRVESKENEGSTFYFTLPNNSPEKEVRIQKSVQKADNKKYSGLKGIKVLIAEDEELADLYLSIVLREMSAEIFHAGNGIEAIDMIKEHHDIDLILMDIKMPLMGGYEATRAIREFDEEVIIISQTAYALAGDREKAIEAGCDDYIAKPIDKERLKEMIFMYLNK